MIYNKVYNMYKNYFSTISRFTKSHKRADKRQRKMFKIRVKPTAT